MYNTTISSATNDKPSSAEEWAAFWCNRIERHWPELLPNLAEKLQKLIFPFICKHKCHPTDIKTDELCNFLKNNKQYSVNECNFIKTAFLILYSKVCKQTEKTVKIIETIETLFSDARPTEKVFNY